MRKYFKNRPDDYLELDISENNAWINLCKFLNKDIPEEIFPHQNKTGHRKKKRTSLHKYLRKIKKHLHYSILLFFIQIMGYEDFERKPGTLPKIDREDTSH